MLTAKSKKIANHVVVLVNKKKRVAKTVKLKNVNTVKVLVKSLAKVQVILHLQVTQILLVMKS